jgi:hypothetical protein
MNSRARRTVDKGKNNQEKEISKETQRIALKIYIFMEKLS